MNKVNINTKLFNSLIRLALQMSDEAQKQLLTEACKIYDWDKSRNPSTGLCVDTEYNSKKQHPNSVCKDFFPFLKEYAQLNDTQKAGIVLSLAKMFPDINLGQECEVEVNVKVKQIPLERRLLENYPKADMGKVREIAEDSVNDFYPEIEI